MTKKTSKKHVPPEVLGAFEQGRQARISAIAREDAPFGDGEALKEWQRGWDSVEEAED